MIGLRRVGRWQTKIYIFPSFCQKSQAAFIIISGNQLKQKVWPLDTLIIYYVISFVMVILLA